MVLLTILGFNKEYTFFAGPGRSLAKISMVLDDGFLLCFLS